MQLNILPQKSGVALLDRRRTLERVFDDEKKENGISNSISKPAPPLEGDSSLGLVAAVKEKREDVCAQSLLFTNFNLSSSPAAISSVYPDAPSRPVKIE